MEATLRTRGWKPLQLRCLFPELGGMCGYAVTGCVETVTDTEPRDNRRFMELYRMVEHSSKPAVVVLQEIGAFSDYAAHAGEVMSTIFQRVGAVGLVSDCAVRDVPEVRAMGFHYFARGTVASHANFRVARVGVPVQVLGLVVRPGDLLHGDENGLTLVPDVGRNELPEMVKRIREREGELLTFVRSRVHRSGRDRRIAGVLSYLALDQSRVYD